MKGETNPHKLSSVARGARGEDLAADYLTRQGLQVVARNFRIRGGEIDLICRDGTEWVFVEVRLRSGKGYGGAAASITAAKQARLALAARHYLARRGDLPCRFDCLLIEAGRIEWLRDAFRPG